MQTWRHPQNRKYILYYHANTAGRSHGHKQQAKKIGKIWSTNRRIVVWLGVSIVTLSTQTSYRKVTYYKVSHTDTPVTVLDTSHSYEDRVINKQTSFAQSNLGRAEPQSPHWLQWPGTPQIHPQNCLIPFDDHHPYLIHSSLDRPHSPSQTTSGSTQPFCHKTLCGQTDRQTDRPTYGPGECSVT